MVTDVFKTTFFPTNSKCPLPSRNTSAGHGYFPSGITQNFIPQGSGPMAVLSELSDYNFPLTLV